MLGATGRSSTNSVYPLVLNNVLGTKFKVVTGYQGGDTNPVDGKFTVRQSDAHAWAEVFVPGAGWLGLDATSGLFAGEGHIPLACTPDPVSAAPVSW